MVGEGTERRESEKSENNTIKFDTFPENLTLDLGFRFPDALLAQLWVSSKWAQLSIARLTLCMFMCPDFSFLLFLRVFYLQRYFSSTFIIVLSTCLSLSLLSISLVYQWDFSLSHLSTTIPGLLKCTVRSIRSFFFLLLKKSFGLK